MQKIENKEMLDSLRTQNKERIENSKCRVLICAGTGCLASGSGEIYEKIKGLIGENPDVEVHFGPEIAHMPTADGGSACPSQAKEVVGVKKSGCHGFCEMGPLVRIEPYNYLYIKVKPEDCEEIYQTTILNGEDFMVTLKRL